jgi:hypothetical protein
VSVCFGLFLVSVCENLLILILFYFILFYFNRSSQEIIQFMEARKRGEFPKRPSPFAAASASSSSTAGANATAELNAS